MTKEKTESRIVCDYCGSDNVQSRVWILPNRNNEFVDLMSEEMQDNWCCDEKCNCSTTSIEVNVGDAVIGFQVWGEDGSAQEGEMHPLMVASFYVYSLDQANAMIDDDNNGNEHWKLRTIWTDTIEEPILMFSGDPRA